MRRCTLTLGIGLVLVAPLAASAASLYGSVSGPDGARLPAAHLRLTSQADDTTLSVATSGQGLYYVNGLRAGRYTLTVAAPRLADFRQDDILLAVDEARRLDVRLIAATRQEQIDVVAQELRDSVEAEELSECPAPDLGQALDGELGLARVRRGTLGSDVVVRGMRGRDVTVLIDGQGICPACPNRMDPPLFHVDLAEVQRVEVVRGPFDVKNMGGLGGTLNVVTRRPPPGIEIEPAMSYGTAGAVNPSLAAAWGGARFSALGGASYREATAYRDGRDRRITESAPYRTAALDTDAYRVNTAWARLFHHNEGGLIQLAYTRQRADHVLYPTLQMDAVYDDTDRVQLQWETAHTRTQAGYARVGHWMTDEYRNSAVGAPRAYSMGTRAEARTFGARFGWEQGDVKLGAEIGRRYWDTRTELASRAYAPQASLAAATTDTAGVFALLEHDLTLALSVSAGLRVDHARSRVEPEIQNLALLEAYHGAPRRTRDDWLPAGVLKALWRRGRSQVALSLGHAARPPEPHERYYALERSGSDWVGNPRLAPGRTTGVDLSYRIETARLRLAGSLFANHIADYVTVLDQARQTPPVGSLNSIARTYGNVAATLIGAEAQASLIVTSRFFLDTAVSLTRGSQTPDPTRGIDSSALAEMLPARGRLALRYDDARLWAKIESAFAARQVRVNSDLREEPTPGYAVINAALGVQLGGARITCGAANVFNHYYVEALSYYRDPFRTGLRLAEPGRTLYVNAAMRLRFRTAR